MDRTIVKTLRMKPDTIKKVQEFAKKENRSFSNMVDTILLNYEPKDAFPI